MGRRVEAMLVITLPPPLPSQIGPFTIFVPLDSHAKIGSNSAVCLLVRFRQGMNAEASIEGSSFVTRRDVLLNC